MGLCENCHCNTYRGLCVNCHEENFIEEQYMDMDMEVPERIYEKARQNEADAWLGIKEEGE